MTTLTDPPAASVQPATAPSPQTPSPPAIQTIDLLKRFGKRTAVNHLNLAVPRGSTYGLIGLNGAGKSTAIRTIMGLIPATSGRILIDGLDMPAARVPLMSRIGYVPDRPTAYGWMRIAEVLAFTRSLRANWDESRAAAMLAHYRLDPRQKIRTLSKGQGAKLSLLLALAHNPSILILDEPTDGLDPVARDDFLELVLSSVADAPPPPAAQRTVLISSHNLLDLQRIADTIGILHDGQLIVQQPTEALLASAKRIVIVLADPAHPPPAPPGAVCTRRRARELIITVLAHAPESLAALAATPGVNHAHIQDISLEDIFKDIIRGRAAAMPETTP